MRSSREPAAAPRANAPLLGMWARLRTPAAVPIVLGVCSLTLAVAYLVKECPAALFGQDRTSWVGLWCYTDIVGLYEPRGLEQGVFPYVHGYLQHGAPAGGAIEYPVLTGLFMWMAATLASGANDYLRVTVLLMFPLGLLTAFLLTRMAGWRALLWAAAPALALYAFVNWELLVVAAAVTGFWLWRRNRFVWAGLAFGIGAALKLFPILFLAPLALERWRSGDGRAALQSAAAGLAVFAVVNLPFVVAGPAGWFATYQYQSLRGPNYDTIWQLGVPPLTPLELNFVSGMLTAALFAAALVWGAMRAGRYPFLQVSAACVAATLLMAKVHSSQYALWIMPFFALLEVGVAWWVAYALADLTRFAGTMIQLHHPGLSDALMTAGVWARAALLLVLFVLFLRARPASGMPAVAAGGGYR
jgi:Glycosyltransferase family 87